MNNIKSLWFKAVVKRQAGILWSICRGILWIVSLGYLIILKIRRVLYQTGLIRKTHLPIRVISVGNITLGGTGKTPMVAYIAKTLLAQGKKVAILSRGYGRIPTMKDDEEFIIDDLSGKNIIRLVGPNRTKLARTACKEHGINVIILDDGFQHLRLRRDLDIVMIDCTNPFGNGHLLPAGILREPLSNLARADLFVLSHTNLVPDDELNKLEQSLRRFNKPIIHTIHKPVSLNPISICPDSIPINLTSASSAEPCNLWSKKAYGFCGIGNPDAFGKTLEQLRVNLVGFSIFPDHHLYTEKDIAKIDKMTRARGTEILITTQKDETRLTFLTQDTNPLPIYTLKIELEVVKDQERLEACLINPGVNNAPLTGSK